MLRPPTRSPRPDPLLPSTALFRSAWHRADVRNLETASLVLSARRYHVLPRRLRTPPRRVHGVAQRRHGFDPPGEPRWAGGARPDRIGELISDRKSTRLNSSH